MMSVDNAGPSWDTKAVRSSQIAFKVTLNYDGHNPDVYRNIRQAIDEFHAHLNDTNEMFCQRENADDFVMPVEFTITVEESQFNTYITSEKEDF